MKRAYNGKSRFTKRASEAPFSNDQAVVNTALSFLNDRFGGQWNELRFWFRDDILDELEKYLSGHPAEGIIADIHAYLTYDMAFEGPQAIREEMFPKLLAHALRHFGNSPTAAAEADESEIEEALYETLERFYYEDRNLYGELRERFFEHIGKTSNLNTERKNAMNRRNRKNLVANRKGYKSKLDLYFSAFDRSGDMVEITAKPDGNGYIWSYQGPDYGDYDYMFITLPFEEAYDLFLREMGLTQGDFWGPEIYTHTSNRRANRRVAEYDTTNVFQNEGVWEIAEMVWDSRLLSYDVSDEVIEETIRNYSEVFLGEVADTYFVDSVMSILKENLKQSNHRANLKVSYSKEDEFEVHDEVVEKFPGGESALADLFDYTSLDQAEINSAKVMPYIEDAVFSRGGDQDDVDFAYDNLEYYFQTEY